jgi:hypothetical protein
MTNASVLEMPNNILVLGTLAAVGWAAVSALPSPQQPEPRTIAPAPVIAQPSHTHHTTAGPNAVEARRPPVPLVRSTKVFAAPGAPIELAIEAIESQKQDDLDKKAAKLAVEMDGYKRVTIVGRTSSGAWRAKAYRGATELLLVVDGTGRVSTD